MGICMHVETIVEGSIVMNRLAGDFCLKSAVEIVRDQVQKWTEHHFVWDLTNASLAHISTSEWKSLLPKTEEVAKNHSGHCVLVSSSDFHYGMIRMLEIVAALRKEPPNIRAFRTTEEALVWIENNST